MLLRTARKPFTHPGFVGGCSSSSSSGRGGPNGRACFSAQPPGAARSYTPVQSALSMDAVVAYCKRRGFVFPGSELYGSIGTGFDYGPLGTMLKKNIQDAWWRDFIERRPDCVAIDAAILANPRVWEASGHVKLFCDPVSECSTCHRRVRVDKLLQRAVKGKAGGGGGDGASPVASVDSLSLLDMGVALRAFTVACPHCGAIGDAGLGVPEPFNMLFCTNVGPGGQPVTEGSGAKKGKGKGAAGAGAATNPNATTHAYLRPETAQGVYVNFMNVMNTTRGKLPLGIGQVGKSFRNEIAVGNFVFRTREFEQMELQYFCNPQDSGKWFDYWVDNSEAWLLRYGMRPESIRRKSYSQKELAHYALATTDLEFRFPFGWDELWGIANRGDYDLRAHAAGAGVSMEVKDPVSNTSYVPHAVEPAVGLNRLFLAFLCDSLWVEQLPAKASPAAGGPAAAAAGQGAEAEESDTRTVLRIHEDLAPFKLAVLPQMKKDGMMEHAQTLHAALLQHFPVEFDATQSIGKRYRRQDEIGTPMCLTVDHQTLEDGTVTVRCRDTMRQIRMPTQEVLQRANDRTMRRSALEPQFQAVASA